MSKATQKKILAIKGRSFLSLNSVVFQLLHDVFKGYFRQ